MGQVQVYEGLFSATSQLSEPERKLLFAGTASSQTSSPQAAGLQPCQQPVPLRGPGSDSCPGLKHWPGRLPKRPGPHPLSHHPFRLGLDVKRKNMEKHVWQHLQEQYHLQTPLATAASVHGLAMGGGFEDSEEGRRPDSVQFSHSPWRSHVALSMVPRKISHACFPSESMDPKGKWRN